MGAMSLRSLLSLWMAAIILMAGCQKKEEPSAASATATQLPPAVAAPAITQASWAPDALEELLAPIALYPDQLLTQILAASVNAQEVLDGGNWLLENQNLQGAALDTQATKAGFGAAMRALLQFPTVVDMLCQQIDWTRQVGSAFTSDQKGVLDAVQRLRLQAAQLGNLTSTPQQTVETKTENNQTIVEVKPADPQIVYVPQYNPQVVYTTPPPAPAPATTNTTSSEDTVSTGTAVAAGVLAFGAGILLGNAMDDDDDDCCYPNWGHSTVIVGSRPFYPPAYAYRPAYGSGFRPAYGYNSPPGYRNNYRGGNNNININNINANNDYYNRFNKNQNLRASSAQSPLRENRVAQNTANRGDGWKGQSTYKGQSTGQSTYKGQSTYRGARDSATTQRPNQAAGNRQMANDNRRQEQMRLADSSNARNSFSRDRPTQSQSARTHANVDRGYGDSARAPERSTNAQRPAPTPQVAQDRGAERDNALSGSRSRDSGSFDRAASARGRASSGGSGRANRGGGGHRQR